MAAAAVVGVAAAELANEKSGAGSAAADGSLGAGVGADEDTGVDSCVAGGKLNAAGGVGGMPAAGATPESSGWCLGRRYAAPGVIHLAITALIGSCIVWQAITRSCRGCWGSSSWGSA